MAALALKCLTAGVAVSSWEPVHRLLVLCRYCAASLPVASGAMAWRLVPLLLRRGLNALEEPVHALAANAVGGVVAAA